jgi:hypothetical protein
MTELTTPDPDRDGLPATSFPNLLAFLLALLGPWGITTAMGALALVLLCFGLGVAWQASPRLPANSANDIVPPPIDGAVGSDSAQQPSPAPPPTPGGQKAK